MYHRSPTKTLFFSASFQCFMVAKWGICHILSCIWYNNNARVLLDTHMALFSIFFHHIDQQCHILVILEQVVGISSLTIMHIFMNLLLRKNHCFFHKVYVLDSSSLFPSILSSNLLSCHTHKISKILDSNNTPFVGSVHEKLLMIFLTKFGIIRVLSSPTTKIQHYIGECCHPLYFYSH